MKRDRHKEVVKRDHDLLCKRDGGNGWRCKRIRFENKSLCEKHYFQWQRWCSANRPRNTVKTDFILREGQEVEVASKEKGFEDSWFVATVVYPLVKRKNNKSLVKYQSLVDETGSNPLQEYVELSQLRPLQPKGTPRLFKPGEEVDAFVNEGWWKGVITKVHEDSNYSVYFKPSKETMEFQQSELRLHMEWIHGKWVSPPKYKEPTGSSAVMIDMATPQTQSEARNSAWEDVLSVSRSTCGWMDDQSTPEETCLPYNAILSGLENMKQSDPRSYAKVLKCIKQVTDKEATESPKAGYARGTSNDSPTDTQYGISLRTRKGKRWLRRKLSTESSSHLYLDVMETEQFGVVGSPKPHVKFQKERHEQMEELFFHTETEEVVNQTENVAKKKRGRPKGSGKNHKMEGSSKSQDLSMTLVSKGPESESTRNIMTTVEREFTESPCYDEEERQSPIVEGNGDSEDEGMDNNLTIFQMDSTPPLSPPETTLRETSLESPKHPQPSKEVECSISVDAIEDERALQPSIDITTNTHSSPTQRDEGSTLLENASLPFIKCSFMWKSIETKEVFKLIQQNPHFRPLEKENEELREGFALGYMISYSNLMERTCEAQFDDPRSVFESRLNVLTDLEEFGFTVEPIRSRLQEMIKIKDQSSQLEKLKTVERMLIEEKCHFDEMQECITQLNMQLQALLMEKEMKCLKVAEMQREVNEIKDSIGAARVDFQSMAAATWNYDAVEGAKRLAIP